VVRVFGVSSMKPGDLVRIIPDENDEPDRYDGPPISILENNDE